ncbi:MAG: HU family DNA-binding protein [Planctomycetota bacterium]|jgi:integration host factor subunit beta|nr:HU family DNA-binding protein [Planctomycetota bacterium]
MPSTVTKKDLIERIADRTSLKRVTVKKAVQEFLDQVIVELKRGNRLEFRDFGVFEIKERAARTAQNPKTLQRVEVPPKKTVKFKVGRLMRESIDRTPVGGAASGAKKA